MLTASNLKKISFFLEMRNAQIFWFNRVVRFSAVHRDTFMCLINTRKYLVSYKIDIYDNWSLIYFVESYTKNSILEMRDAQMTCFAPLNSWFMGCLDRGVKMNSCNMHLGLQNLGSLNHTLVPIFSCHPCSWTWEDTFACWMHVSHDSRHGSLVPCLVLKQFQYQMIGQSCPGSLLDRQ